MSENSTLFSELENFAENNDRKPQWDIFKTKIQAEIKMRLPMFFNKTAENFSLKSEDEIIDWHIQNRINHGAMYIKELQEEAEKIVTENTHYLQKMRK